MTLLRHALREEHYIDTVRDALYEEALNDALIQTSHHFTHFITATFPQPLPLADAVESWHRAMRAIGHDNQGHVKYFVGFALSVAEQYMTINDTRPARERWEGGSEIFAKWHVHALLGGLGKHMSQKTLERRLRTATGGGHCRVAVRDERHRLLEYLSASNTGNRVGRLQRTNVRDLQKLLNAQGFEL